MKLHVKNFGPIREAKVEIRPMTVFVGHSNTGKSYLAMLVYSITKALAIADNRELLFGRVSDIGGASSRDVELVGDIDAEKFFHRDNVEAMIRRKIEDYLSYIKHVWNGEASFCFGDEWKKNAEQEKFSLVITDELNEITFDLSPDKNQYKVSDAFLDKVIGTLKTKLGEKVEEKQKAVLKGKPKAKRSPLLLHDEILIEILDDHSPISIMKVVMDSFEFFSSHIKPGGYPDKRKQNKIHYLPGGRGTVTENHLPIARSIIYNVATAPSDKPSFNGVTTDFIQKLLSFKDSLSISAGRREIAIFADKMEKRIAKGRIKVKISETGFPHFSYAPENIGEGDIPLTRASSAVSELASVVLFIRYYLSRGDIFIVEEPEAGLHTAAQREMAALLVELVNAGVYVFITTHSDVIIEQISNCMQASRLPKGSKIKILHNAKLSPEKINAYTFVERKIGTKVKLIPPDENDPDILSDDHTDVSSDLYNESVRIYNTIHKNGN